MEVFKEVKDYEGIYFVSNLGNVKSVDHYCSGRNGSGKQSGRILKQHICFKGYSRVSLSFNGKRFSTGAHRLVALTFIPNTENKPQVNHINGIKTDNRVENLEWCTNKENQIHAIINKLVKHNTCEKHHMSKLTNKQVLNIRGLYKIGFTNKELAKDHNISNSAMSKILTNQTYINI